jgi:hypothetical protein
MSDKIDEAAAEGAPLHLTTPGARERELWRDHLMRRDGWTYAEALAWLLRRDPAVVADMLESGRAPLYSSSVDVVAGALVVEAMSAPVYEARPDVALLHALQTGDVTATGFNSGDQVRTLIPREHWTDLSIVGASPADNMTLGAEPGPNAWMAGPGGPSCWRKVMFDREAVVAKFPAPEAEAAPAPLEAKQAKSADLGTRERTTAYKLILGLAAKGYGYKPSERGKRDTVVPEIVSDLETLGLAVSDETVRKWLTDAYEDLGKPVLD